MSKHQPPTESSQPPIYQLRVQGQLDRRWANWFDNLTIEMNDNGDTLLVGPIVDQAALYGVLRKVRDAGMTLISVNCNQTEKNNDESNCV